MYEINCIDETFDPNFTTEYTLSIQLSLDGFSFCIRDDIRRMYLVFKHFPFQLSNNTFLLRKVKELLEQQEELGKNYKKVLISIASHKITAIPGTFENPDTEKIFSFNFDKAEDENVLTLQEDFFKINLAFSFPSEIEELLSRHFNKAVFTHQAELLLKLAAQRAQGAESSTLISISKRFFTIIVTHNKKLAIINSYAYSNNMDVIFYILNIFKSQGLNMQNSPVSLTGELEKESPLVEFLRKNFSKVEFIELAKNYQYSYTFSKFPQHMFVSVINPEQ